MKYKYVVFCPYFGNLPNNFKLWLKSCSYNKDFKFIVFTNDLVDYVIPDNVEIFNLSFDDFKGKIQEKFNFNISLESPYKLCDFKPVYGYVFANLLNNCEYWGYCDMDVVFGNLKKFLPKEKYDKISYLGHFCLYKNTKFIRECFKIKNFSKINYQDILSSPIHFGFDEIGDYGINNIFKCNNLTIYNYELNVADIDCRNENFVLVKLIDGKFKFFNGVRIFSFENGSVIENKIKGNTITKNEFAYIHFQKRKMNINVDEESNNFIITPHSFEMYQNIDINIINNYQIKMKVVNTLWFKFKFRALKNRIRRFKEIKKIIDAKHINK